MATLWTLRGTTVLAMADVTGAYEPYAAVPCDILKAAHHGSEDSTARPLRRRLTRRRCCYPHESGSI